MTAADYAWPEPCREVSLAIKAQNPDLETAWRTIAWWEQTCAYWQAEAQKGYALRDGVTPPLWAVRHDRRLRPLLLRR